MSGLLSTVLSPLRNDPESQRGSDEDQGAAGRMLLAMLLDGLGETGATAAGLVNVLQQV